MRMKDLLLLTITLFSTLFLEGTRADERQPSPWNDRRRQDSPNNPLPPDTIQPPVGSVVCRYPADTRDEVNYYTCKELADRYSLPVDEFFKLNPELDRDCKTIRPNTEYCVAGYIQRPLALDGQCGLPHGNATCIGTMRQCCNGDTWTCGDKYEDCRAGTCFAGACEGGGGDVYAIDGKCGPKNGGLKCGGRWGDCCNFDGECGTGEDFCGEGNCESGNCTSAEAEDPEGSPWQSGDTPDGSCGGEDGYTCDVVFGNCCSKDGICGSDVEHCGDGCQSEFGQCSDADTGSVDDSSPPATTDQSSSASRNRIWT